MINDSYSFFNSVINRWLLFGFLTWLFRKQMSHYEGSFFGPVPHIVGNDDGAVCDEWCLVQETVIVVAWDWMFHVSHLSFFKSINCFTETLKFIFPVVVICPRHVDIDIRREAVISWSERVWGCWNMILETIGCSWGRLVDLEKKCMCFCFGVLKIATSCPFWCVLLKLFKF